METFIGKSQFCNMTEFSGAEYKEVFNGNTILLEIGNENNKHRYVYIGGDMVCSFLTGDRIYKYISKMGNNLTPCSIAVGWENIYYSTPYFRFTKKEKIDENDFDKLFEYQNISNCRKLQVDKIHSNYDYYMINKKYYCNICDKYIPNKNSHDKTKIHTQLSLSVVNKYYIVDIPESEIDNIINK